MAYPGNGWKGGRDGEGDCTMRVEWSKVHKSKNSTHA